MLGLEDWNVLIFSILHTTIHQELLAELNVAPIAGSLITFKEGVESRLLDSCATTSPSFKVIHTMSAVDIRCGEWRMVVDRVVNGFGMTRVS